MTPSRYIPPHSGSSRRKSSPLPLPPPLISPVELTSPYNTFRHEHVNPYIPQSPSHTNAPSASSRPPVPSFPPSHRRPITAPPTSRVPPTSYRGATRPAAWRQDMALTPLSPTSERYGESGNIGDMADAEGFAEGTISREHTSSRLDYSLAGPSVHPLSTAAVTYHPHPHSLIPQSIPIALPSARRHSFPRHLHQPPLPSLIAQHPSTLPPIPIRTQPLHHGIPPLPADPSTAHSPAFQPNYTRATTANTRKPVISLDAHVPVSEQVDPVIIRVLPPPTEALLMLRLRRAPRGGWPPVRREDWADWTTSLEIVQEPEMGVCLGTEHATHDTPKLDPPLVIRVQFLSNNQPVPDENPTVAKRIAYMTLHLSLLSTDTDRPVELVIYSSDSDSLGTTNSGLSSSPGNISHHSGSGASDSDSAQSQGPQLALVGSTFGIAKRADLGGAGRDGWYFVFHDLRVRPSGLFRLGAKLIDILGPGPSGTSTGITPVASSVVTRSFTIFGEDQYPGAEPRTELTSLLLEQGLLGGRRGGDGGSSSESD